MSLRAILGGARVKKRAPSANPKTVSSAPRPAKSPSKARAGPAADSDDEDAAEDFALDDDLQLDDSGLVASLASDLSLRDVVQALRYARRHMFDPVPGTGTGRSDPTVDDDDTGNGFSTATRTTAPSTTPSTTPSTAPTGYISSARVAEILAFRARLPPVATTAHIASLLPNATATERETVALVQAGVVRKVVQPQWRRGLAAAAHGPTGGSGIGGGAARGGDSPSKRGGDDARYRKALAIGGESLGEVLVETAQLQALVHASALADATKAAMAQFLAGDNASARDTSTTFTINGRDAPQLTPGMVDELVRAGFLVGHGASAGLVGGIDLGGFRSSAHGRARGTQSDTGDVYARPEDRTTLLSLDTVARAASGSLDAVGGVGAVYSAGGGGARGARGVLAKAGGASALCRDSIPKEDLVLAIPGHGQFVKLVSGALAHLVGILARTPYRETLETTLRERWDAGGTITKSITSRTSRTSRTSSLAYGSFKRVPLSRTKKWKDLYGLRFDWVLAEALGAGLVELFDTGSVGRGVRLLS